jgi:hypothetical protein
MRVISKISAAHADRVDFGDVFGGGKQSGDRAKWISFEVHVEAGYDDADAGICELVADLDKAHVEKLGFVYADNIYTGSQQEDIGRGRHRGGMNFP